MKRISLFFLIFSIIFAACKKNEEVERSTFTIKNENISSTSTSVQWSCEVNCSATIKELYLQYSTKSGFSKYEEVQMTNDRARIYSVSIDNLLENTTYYVNVSSI